MLRPSRDSPLHYHLFVLTLWEESRRHLDGSPIWRYSLEHGITGERKGFKNLAELMAYLAAWTQNPPGDGSFTQAGDDLHNK